MTHLPQSSPLAVVLVESGKTSDNRLLQKPYRSIDTSLMLARYLALTGASRDLGYLWQDGAQHAPLYHVQQRENYHIQVGP